MKTTILELNKTPYENGKKSGEYFKNIVNSDIKKKLELIDKEPALKDKCKKILLTIKDKYPKYYDEIRGKADGLNIELLHYFSIMCPELSEINFEHCTTIMCKKDNGKFILSHNEDDDYLDGNFCLSKVKIDDNNWFVTNDMYNMPFGNGISWNSYGIIKTINYCHEENIKPEYIPRYFSQRHISEAKSIDDLINRCQKMKLASGYHVNAIDINKNIAVSIEVYNENIDVEYINDFYVHSNHYIHKKHLNNQLVDTGSNSIFRLNKSTELLKQSKRNIASIKNILNYRDINNKFEKSIFQNKTDPYITILNLTFDVENKNDILLDVYVNNEHFKLDYNLY